MVDDHSKAVDELKQVAGSQSVRCAGFTRFQASLPHRQHIQAVRRRFRSRLCKDQLKDHSRTSGTFSSKRQNGMDPNVKSYAPKTLPVLQQHLEMAKNLNSQVKK